MALEEKPISMELFRIFTFLIDVDKDIIYLLPYTFENNW